MVGAHNPRPDRYSLITADNQANQGLRSWDKGQLTSFSQTFQAPSVPGTYQLRLYLPDTDCVDNPYCSTSVAAHYAIRLATKRGDVNVFDPTTGTNDLGVTLTVNAP